MACDETLHGEATGGVKGLHEAGPNAAGAAERSPMWLLGPVHNRWKSVHSGFFLGGTRNDAQNTTQS